MSKLTLVTAAYRVRDEQILNFFRWNERVFCENDVEVVVVTDREVKLPNMWGRCVVYPRAQPKFSIGRTVNYGIRRVEGDGADVIAKTDIDIIFSDEVVKHVKATVKPGTGMTCFFSWVNSETDAQPEAWSMLDKCYTGFGACFAMARCDWWILKGYDERIWGWGADDDEILARASKRIEVLRDDTCPLFHIKHKPRKSFMQDTYFPDRAQENLRLSGWADDHWGEAKQDDAEQPCTYPYRRDQSCVVMFGDLMEWNEHMEFLGALAYAKQAHGQSIKGIILASAASSDAYVDKIRGAAKHMGIDVEVVFVKAAVQPSGDASTFEGIRKLGFPIIARLTDVSGEQIDHEQNGYVYGHPTWAGQWLDTLLRKGGVQ